MLRIKSVFEGSGFRRRTFDHHSKAHPPSHFGQWVLVLYQFCTNVQLRSRSAHDNVVQDSKKMKHHRNSRDAASPAPLSQQQAPLSALRNSTPTLPAAAQSSPTY